jgi:NAD(P)H-flavin reductase
MPYTVVEARALAPAITELLVAAPLAARRAKPGQFVIVRVAERGERVPLTIVDAAGGLVRLVVQAVGKTTRQICGLRAGESLLDVAGLLGSPTHIERQGTVACIGGGVGAAEIYPIARALRQVGNDVRVILGARCRDLVILESELRACASELVVTTDDGSYGRSGVVTGPLAEWLEEPRAIDAVYAAGPLPMMKAVAEATRPYGVRTWTSLNPLMVDGTGMCGGCRVTVGGAVRFACVDGPDFDAHQVDFDELMRRNRAYADLERQADQASGGSRP